MRSRERPGLWSQLWRHVQFESVLLLGLVVVTVVFGLNIARQLMVRRQVEQQYLQVQQELLQNYARERELARLRSVQGSPQYYLIWARRYFHWGLPGMRMLQEPPAESPPPPAADEDAISPYWWDEWWRVFHLPGHGANRAPN